MCNKFENIKGWPCRLQQEMLATRYMKMSGATVFKFIKDNQVFALLVYTR